MATPGHTYEHLAYLVYEGDAAEPAAVFTGGSLLVGSAGRPDLLGADHTDELTRAQYDSLRRLAALPATAQVLPTHGAGSFCVAAMPTTRRTSTIDAERRDNPLLTAPQPGRPAALPPSGPCRRQHLGVHLVPVGREAEVAAARPARWPCLGELTGYGMSLIVTFGPFGLPGCPTRVGSVSARSARLIDNS